MQDDQRGKIRNKEQAGQFRDFSGVRFGNITPTDIDGLLEYHNKGYVIIETKYRGAALPFGQQLALERLCDDLQKTKPTLLVIAAHESTGDIDVAATVTADYRFNGEWRQARMTTKALITAFINYLDQQWEPVITIALSTTA